MKGLAPQKDVDRNAEEIGQEQPRARAREAGCERLQLECPVEPFVEPLDLPGEGGAHQVAEGATEYAENVFWIIMFKPTDSGVDRFFEAQSEYNAEDRAHQEEGPFDRLQYPIPSLLREELPRLFIQPEFCSEHLSELQGPEVKRALHTTISDHGEVVTAKFGIKYPTPP